MITMAKARRRVWERLATTARADIDGGDWTTDEEDFEEGDHEKYMRACDQVADSIEKRLARPSKTVQAVRASLRRARRCK